MLLVNSGLIFEGEIKIKSSYFLTLSNSSCVIGPIIIFTPWDLISRMAASSFSLSLNPESLGIIKYLYHQFHQVLTVESIKVSSPTDHTTRLMGQVNLLLEFYYFLHLKG